MASLDKQLETLMTLANSCWTEYDTRRSYEWKVSFGLWTAIGIISGFALKEDFLLPFSKGHIGLIVFIILLVVIFMGYYYFQRGLFTSNKHDQAKRHYYINNHIHPIVNVKHDDMTPEIRKLFEEPPIYSAGKKVHQVWSHRNQIIITGTFILILICILVSKECGKETRINKALRHHNRIELLR